MRIFGLEISRAKALPASLHSVPTRTPWWGWLSGPIHEPFTGAWQRNITADAPANLLAFSAVYACVTGIASDVAKLRIKLSENNNGIWVEITANQPWLPVLRKPNHYQTRIEFIEYWMCSKLLFGNTYALKRRQDARGIVTDLYVLDPKRVKPLVTETGDVYYELDADHISGIEDIVTVPASEIIHDKMPCLWHPLVGVPPIYACGISATMGNRIQANSTGLFSNQSLPGGILTAVGRLTDEQARKLKDEWDTNFRGANAGKTAVLADGLKFEAISMPAEQSQLIEQLEWTVADVGRAFHYPQWKLGGPMPPYSSGPEAMTTAYYTDCLQTLIEKFELCLDEGLELPTNIGTEMDLDNLMRMDTIALYESNNKAVSGAWMKPNEARFRANLLPVEGGDSPMIQQQNYSLAAIAKRDAQEDPFGKTPPRLPPTVERAQLPANTDFETEDAELFGDELMRVLTP